MTKGPELALEQQISEMVAVFSDPIIVYPGGWQDSLPEKIKQDITTYRLIRMLKGDLDLATWPEVCAYFYTLTLCFPPQERVVRMYMYAMTQYKGDLFPEDLRRETLEAYEMDELNRFRRWIRAKQLEARKVRQRLNRPSDIKQARASETKDSEQRPSLFDFNFGQEGGDKHETVPTQIERQGDRGQGPEGSG